mmetsp:Transcript_10397/g.17215  ORF Transcript_10397/g.17215 Transcript_10397/m.17215 type:complete len:201 (-) Transcript_10397:2407-3009(-)
MQGSDITIVIFQVIGCTTSEIRRSGSTRSHSPRRMASFMTSKNRATRPCSDPCHGEWPSPSTGGSALALSGCSPSASKAALPTLTQNCFVKASMIQRYAQAFNRTNPEPKFPRAPAIVTRGTSPANQSFDLSTISSYRKPRMRGITKLHMTRAYATTAAFRLEGRRKTRGSFESSFSRMATTMVLDCVISPTAKARGSCR